MRNPAQRSAPVSEATDKVSRCWCGRTEVMVTAEDVRRGRTISCGTKRCEAMAHALG